MMVGGCSWWVDGSQLSPFHQDCPFAIFHNLCFDTGNNCHDDVRRDGGRGRVRGDRITFRKREGEIPSSVVEYVEINYSKCSKGWLGFSAVRKKKNGRREHGNALRLFFLQRII